ncbi:MAG: YitT family protein [Lachnospiraceae bacterium]|nr:YitT family protein [Lachnospiraceae bacterium]
MTNETRWNGGRDVRRLISVLLAACLYATTVRIFVNAGNLFPGGITGLTVLIQRIVQKFLNIQLPFAVVNILLNVFPVYIGFRFIGKKFTAFSMIMIFVSSILTDVIPYYPLTYDPLLIAVFGGLLSGISISICLRADATSGGTDFFAIYLSQKKGMDAFDYILAFNIAMLVVAGLLFGWNSALYSIVFQFCSTEMIHLFYRDYQQQTLFIVTDKPDEICKAIYQSCNHGATIFRGEGSYGHSEKDMVYSVVSGQEAKHVMQIIRRTDPDAFVNSIRTTEIKGKFYLRPKD